MNFVTGAILSSRRTAIIAFVLVSILTGFGGGDGFSQSAARLEIKTLSSRSDLVSGGDALVEVKAPAGTQLSQLTLTLNGKDVTNQLRLDPATGGFRGLISEMNIGDNTLLAKLKSPKPAQASRNSSARSLPRARKRRKALRLPRRRKRRRRSNLSLVTCHWSLAATPRIRVLPQVTSGK